MLPLCDGHFDSDTNPGDVGIYSLIHSLMASKLKKWGFVICFP